MFAADNSARMAGIKDEMTIAAGKVTPGVDDTEYIQYALEALTRDRDSTSTGQRYPSGTSATYSDFSRPRRFPRPEMAYTPVTPPQPAYVQDHYDMPLEERMSTDSSEPLGEENVRNDRDDHVVDDSSPETVVRHANPNPVTPSSPSTFSRSSHEERWYAINKDERAHNDPKGFKFPPLEYKPAILRPLSMGLLMFLCLLMVAALIFSAIWSANGHGLTPYPGSIYSGQYFVFRILPQILAAVILIYSQSIVATSLRILPFTALASEDRQDRKLALFQSLYQSSFLLPRLVGPWQFKVFSITTWLMLFTIPLQSTAFTCVFEGESWIWAAVQGVAWTLAVLYIIQLFATALLMTYWLKRWTGLQWDVRSIGDLLPLLYWSNTLQSYESMHLCPGDQFKTLLQDRHLDRLGYWASDDARRVGYWYTIGTSAVDEEATINIIGKRASLSPVPSNIPHAFEAEAPYVRYRYAPLVLRSVYLMSFILSLIAIITAILVVSFIQSTRLDEGFNPLLPSRPGKGAFSAANFLYGFIPSLIGMFLFLLFQSVDHALRVHRPWQELSDPNGAAASKSLMADYAACLPFQSTWRAAKNGHWRVAIMSLMATLFVFIPILAGGLFMALTNSRRQVKMFPNMPVFGVLLAFLFLYLGCLVLMWFHRNSLRLPHPVNSLAEIISLCSAEETVHNKAFREVRSRLDLETRLGLHRDDPRDESIWFFGVSAGRDEQRLSVRPLQRLTEKRTRSMRSSRSMR